MSEPRKIVAQDCHLCPFNDGAYYCGADGRRFDEDERGSTPPAWRPLRQGPVTVELEVQS